MSRWLLAGLVITLATVRMARADVLFASPARVYESVQRGEDFDTTVKITSAENAVSISARLLPFALDAHGRPRHHGGDERTIGDWLRIDTRAMVVDPKHPIEIHLRGLAPATATGTYWTSLLIEWRSEVLSENGSMIGATVRLAIPVVITIAGTEVRRATLEDVAGVVKQDQVVIQARIHNTGNTAIYAPVTFAIEKAAEGLAPLELASGDSDPILLLPGATRDVVIRLPKPADMRGVTVAAFYRFGPAGADLAILNGMIATGTEPPKPGKPI